MHTEFDFACGSTDYCFEMWILTKYFPVNVSSRALLYSFESVQEPNIDETRNDNQNDGKTGDDGDDKLPNVEDVKKVCQKLSSLHKEMYDHPMTFSRSGVLANGGSIVQFVTHF